MSSRWVLVLIGLLIGLGVGLFRLTHHREEVEEDVGFQGKARLDDYYAASLLLTQLGSPAEAKVGLGDLTKTDHAVVLFDTSFEQRKAVVGTLQDWVSRGGHLILAPVLRLDLDDQTEADPLLRGTGIELEVDPISSAPLHGTVDDDTDYEVEIRGSRRLIFSEELSQAPAQQSEQTEDAEESEQEAAAPSAPDPSGASDDASAEDIDPDQDLAPDKAAAGDLVMGSDLRTLSMLTQDEEIPVAARIAYGKGEITVVLDAEAFNNKNLGSKEHATFLTRLLQQDNDALPKSVLFVRGGSPTTWFDAIWKHAWAVVVSGGILLLVVLWLASRRFGPLLPDAVPERRSVLEHVISSGHYLWKQKQTQALLTSARTALLRTLHVRGAEVKGNTVLQALLAKKTRRAPSEVQNALEADPPKDKLGFTRMIQELQEMRRTR